MILKKNGFPNKKITLLRNFPPTNHSREPQVVFPLQEGQIKLLHHWFLLRQKVHQLVVNLSNLSPRPVL